jgi:hypothetical protein
VCYFFGLNYPGYAFMNGFHGQLGSEPAKPFHALFNRGKGLQVLCGGVKLPFIGTATIIRNIRIPGLNTAVSVQVSDFPGLFGGTGIDPVHEFENILLAVGIRRNFSAYGNDFTQGVQ